MWLPMWVPLVERHAAGGFYPGYARLVLDACKHVDAQAPAWRQAVLRGPADTPGGPARQTT